MRVIPAARHHPRFGAASPGGIDQVGERRQTWPKGCTVPLASKNERGIGVARAEVRKAQTVARDSGQAQLSRFLRAIDALTSKAGTATVIALGVGFAVAALAAVDFPSRWTSAFSVCAAAVTLVMVFVIQHTQSREQTATQLKLDELIRALPQADDHLVHVEAAKDQELEDLERRQTAHHASLRAER